ncbi:MAG: lipoprotein-releasing system ATP-binding protein LolD [Legionellales bacterium]|nr:lipoprotein-releasing system ATP-binding protein LolD [Legionellales bacterium]|tara:strand:- start:12 stop:692 length:681 start_codon:yes stop_codon:yes gene_type:complete
MNDILNCKQLEKVFNEGSIHTQVLKGIDLSVKKGEQIAIIGSSGSGKSTLLHILGGLDKPSHGQVLVNNIDIHALSETKRCQLRNKTLGFVYQLHHLLPEFSVFENVCMPLMLSKIPKTQVCERAEKVLNRVGLSHRLDHKLSEISGGERQRTAIARALVTNPLCVLADEPTGNLDNKTAESVYELMLELNQVYQTSFIIVTHDMQLAKRMDRILTLDNGLLSSEK